MNILLLNQDWFRRTFEAHGHKVKTCGIGLHLDVVLDQPLIHIDSLLSHQLTGFNPDVILVLDNSAPITVEGLEETKIPTVFYSVDVQHHHYFHKYLFHVFDHTLVAQKDYISHFTPLGGNPEWMPLWAPRYVEASLEKQYQAVFVGNMDPALNPDRVKFFQALKEKIDVYTTIGKYWEIFPLSEIVINQTVKGDLNFRVFEAMMCGALLLTEMSGNGLTELFTPDEHLITYQKGNVEEAADKINALLSDRSFCRKVAEQGRAEILRAHTEEVRASRILDIFKSLQKKSSPIRYFAWMLNYQVLAAKLLEIDAALSRQAIISSLKAAEKALNAGELLDEDLSAALTHACYFYDQHIRTGAGARFLQQAQEAYPDQLLLSLAQIRNYLNQGNLKQASELAQEKVPHKSAQEVFHAAEDIVQQLLRVKTDSN